MLYRDPHFAGLGPVFRFTNRFCLDPCSPSKVLFHILRVIAMPSVTSPFSANVSLTAREYRITASCMAADKYPNYKEVGQIKYGEDFITDGRSKISYTKIKIYQNG